MSSVEDVGDELLHATSQDAREDALSSRQGPVAPSALALPSVAVSSHETPAQPIAASPCVVPDTGAAPAQNDTLLSPLLLQGPPQPASSTSTQPLLYWHRGKVCVTVQSTVVVGDSPDGVSAPRDGAP